MDKTNGLFETLLKERQVLMNYLKAKFPLFHNSNFFYRDLEYGIKGYFEKKSIVVNGSLLKDITNKFAQHLEDEKIFIKTSSFAWKVNYPEFTTTAPGDPF